MSLVRKWIGSFAFSIVMTACQPGSRGSAESQVAGIVPLPKLLPKSVSSLRQIGKQVAERFVVRPKAVGVTPQTHLKATLFEVIADQNGIPRSQMRSILGDLVDSSSKACAGVPCGRVFGLEAKSVDEFLDSARESVLKDSRLLKSDRIEIRTVLLASFRDDLIPDSDVLAPGVIRRPLTARLYPSAKELLDRVFKAESGEDLGAAEEVAQSLSGKAYKEAETGKLVTESRFWVVLDENTDRVGGIVGLYRYKDDTQAEWLNWFAVHPDFRGMSLGGKLLDGAITEAKATGRPYLRLFTDDEPYEEAAQKVYESRGLRLVGKEKHENSEYHRLFRELKLH
jgi:ribosomal protein S18 acetylase RimI-like enzyme